MSSGDKFSKYFFMALAIFSTCAALFIGMAFFTHDERWLIAMYGLVLIGLLSTLWSIACLEWTGK